MASQVLRLNLNIATHLGVVIPVGVLPKQVQTMKLMEHLDSDAIAGMSCLGILDLERIGVETQFVELSFGNHLIAHIICDMIPGFIDFGPVSDKLRHLEGWSNIVSDRMEICNTFCGSYSMSIEVETKLRLTHSKGSLADYKRHFVKGSREVVMKGRRTPKRRRVRRRELSISRLDVRLVVK
jgi:hypothetical protein